MAVIIPQVVTEDRASGAQFIDGSLTINGSNQYLTRTHTASNTKTWTFSCWVKKQRNDAYHQLFTGFSTGANQSGIIFMNDDTLRIYSQGGLTMDVVTSAKYRDAGWMNVVVAVDTKLSTTADRVKLWVNGTRVTSFGTATYPSQDDATYINTNITHYVGSNQPSSNTFYGQYAQAYFLDGITAGPEEFGYTDPLTNTWRPKKYGGEFNGPSTGSGTVYSSTSTASNAATMFDGSTSTYASSAMNSGSYQTVTEAPITFTSGSFTYNTNNGGATGGSNYRYLRLTRQSDGATTELQVNNTNGWTIPTGYRNTVISKIEWKRWTSFENVSAVYVDGTMLVDGNFLPAGVNGFYLPMDGNTLIGKDQSGNGNDWTPAGFGGSNSLEKATGAIPILNTNAGGTVSRSGARTDKKTYTVTASGGNYYLDGALKPTLNAYRGGSYTFDYTGATSHPFYLSSLPDGKHNSKAYSVEFDGTGDSCSIGPSSDFTMGTGDFTIECFVQKDNNSHKGILQISDTAGGFATTNYGTTLAIGYQSGVWQIYGTGNSTPSAESASYPINAGQWYHVAYVRHNSVAKLYVDGKEVISRSDTYNFNGTYIGYGGYYNSSYLHDGKISNLRVVKGQALYTSNFTRPSTTLTTTSQGAIASNVKLICCQDSDATTAAVKPGDITVNGDSVARNESPFLYNTNGQEGVNTGTSNTTKITIPHWAADTLYYYCSAHSGMGSSINVTTDIFKADPYAWKCVYAVPLNGAASDESDSLNVNSATKAITTTGASSSPIRNFYSTSLNFHSGSSQYLTTADSSDFDFGAGEFTVEAFIEGPLVGSRTNSVVLNQSTGGASSNSAFYFGCGNDGVSLYLSTNGTSWTNNIEHPQTLGANGWHHIVWQRRSNNLEIYVDGIRVRIGSFTGTINNSSRVVEIGRQSTSGSYFNGRIQDVRVYKGVAKYTENFVVGFTAPDVLPDSPSGITGKTNLTKITDGAVAFDGTGDYLSIAGDTDLQMGTGDFTIECYFNVNGAVPTGCWRGIISLGGHTTDNGITIYAPRADTPVDTVVVILNRVNPTMGSTINVKHGWHHVALVRNSGTTKLYVDGIEQSSISDNNNYDYSGNVYIGTDADCGTTFFQGFISNVRIIKGTALYTSNFTPPTEPLTAVTNTKLLCCQSNTSPTLSAVKPDASLTITANGGASAVTDNPFSSAALLNGSVSFDGTDDELKVSDSGTDLQFGTGDFTVEAFLYYDVAPSSSRYIIDMRSSAGTANVGSLAVGYNGDNTKIEWARPSAAILSVDWANHISTGTWTHIAVARSGSTIRMFIDGQVVSFATDNTNYIDPADITIGDRYINSNATQWFDGFISNLRIVKGRALYTSNFTVPTSALVAVPDTVLLTCTSRTAVTYNEKYATVRYGDVTATNFNPFTDDINTIRGQETGYATLNHLVLTGGATLSNGNLDIIGSTPYRTTPSTIGIKSGKYYWEYSVLDFNGGVTDCHLGICLGNFVDFRDTWVLSTNYGWGYTLQGGLGYHGNSQTNLGSSPRVTGDTIAFSFDADEGELYVYVNGLIVNSGNPAFTGLTNGPYYPFVTTGSSASNVSCNFGQKPFKFPPPDGFQPLNLSNVQPEKVIARPDQYVSATLFTGTGDNVSSRTVELPQDADLVWAKSRDRTSSNQLLDTVRGNNLVLQSNSTSNDRNPITQYTGGGLSTIDGKTITIASGTTNNQNLNVNGNRGVIWSWKAGGSKNTFNIDGEGYANASDVSMNVGALNSYNTSRVWSSGIANSSGDFDQPATNAFNGDRSNTLRTGGNSVLVTLNFSPALTVTNNIQILAEKYPTANFRYTVTVDGATMTKDVDQGQPATFNVSGSLTQITFDNNNSNGRTYLEWIKVDGKELIDSNVTPPNLPSTAPTGCSVGTKQGFSIIRYTGNNANRTIAHGLSEPPKFWIYKNLTDSTNWPVNHTIFGSMRYLYLNLTNTQGNNSSSYWGNMPTSDVLYIGADNDTNGDGDDHIIYAWHDVPGLQKFGSYEGNNTAGAFVELGFRPAIIWIKAIDQTWYWNIHDSKRSPINPDQGNFLRPDQNYVEGTTSGNNNIDFLSNGFKIRSTTAQSEPTNVNGQTYIYCAWAEAPTVNLYGGHANAR